MSATVLREQVAPASTESRPPAGRTGDVLGLVVIAGVLLLLIAGAAPRQDTRGRIVEVTDEISAGAARASLVVRITTEAPGAHSLDALAAMSARAPLLAALPDPPRITVEPPLRPVAERAAAVSFHMAGAAGIQARIDLRDAAGALLDSTFLRFDEHGQVRGAFRVRPAREGWQEWRVVNGGTEGRTGAWVQPARTLRVLIAAGAPDAEARFVTRALEEAGMAVDLRQPLGHGLTAGAAPAGITSADLRAADVVVVLPGAVLTDAQRNELARFAEAGGGVLIAARDPLLHALGLASAAARQSRDVAAEELRWRMPVELAALPAGTVRSRMEGIVPAPDAAAVATADAGQSAGVLVLRASGHGRVAALGLRETWRWRASAGAVDEHREFWRSLVEWLGPPPEPLHVTTAHPFAAVDLPMHAETDAGAPPLTLVRPHGNSEPLAYQQFAADTARLRVTFIPRDTGVHRLTRADGRTVAAARALTDVHHEPAAALTLLADPSGGRTLAADALRDTLNSRDATLPRRTDWRTPAFGLLLLLSLSDWLLRRSRGYA